MTDFLEKRKDWKIDMVLNDQKKGLISHGEAGERILLIEEQYDQARRWRENIG